jgi:hypothetical protein
MKLEEYLVGILCTSGCFWGLFCLWRGLSIQRFIVKRYEVETNLSQTIYFTQLSPFVKYLPDFFSSPLYLGHLLLFVWGWRVVKFIKEKRKIIYYYDDIDKPEDVTRHFSEKEIRKAKRFVLSGFIIAIHGIAYCIFRSIWPEVFD